MTVPAVVVIVIVIVIVAPVEALRDEERQVGVVERKDEEPPLTSPPS